MDPNAFLKLIACAFSADGPLIGVATTSTANEVEIVLGSAIHRSLANVDRRVLRGAVGFGAAIGTVRWTLQGEGRRATRELESIAKALGAEIRQHAHQAFSVI